MLKTSATYVKDAKKLEKDAPDLLEKVRRGLFVAALFSLPLAAPLPTLSAAATLLYGVLRQADFRQGQRLR